MSDPNTTPETAGEPAETSPFDDGRAVAFLQRNWLILVVAVAVLAAGIAWLISSVGDTSSTATNSGDDPFNMKRGDLAQSVTEKDKPLIEARLKATQTRAELLEAIGKLTVADPGTTEGFSLGDWDYNAENAAGSGFDPKTGIAVAEALGATTQEASGTLLGRWWSEFDDKIVVGGDNLAVVHLVQKREAFVSGGATWTPQQRDDFVNDQAFGPVSIAVSDASANDRANQDPADWRPVKKAWCTYATEWVAVKAKYGLTADAAEIAALRDMAKQCPTSLST